MTNNMKVKENTAMFGDIVDIEADIKEIHHNCVCDGSDKYPYPCPCPCHRSKEQQEDMADFIALCGQRDNEALADYDDCSNG
jgi:hypothetical protein